MEVDSQTNKNVPDRVAMKTCKVKAARVHFFRKAVGVDGDAKEVHGHTVPHGSEELPSICKAIEEGDMDHWDGRTKGHQQEDSNTNRSKSLGIPKREHGHDDTSGTNQSSKEHISKLCNRPAVIRVVFGHEYRSSDQDGNANIVESGGQAFDGMFGVTDKSMIDGGANQALESR